MDPWKRRFLLETIISRFQPFIFGCVCLGGERPLKPLTTYSRISVWGHNLPSSLTKSWSTHFGCRFPIFPLLRLEVQGKRWTSKGKRFFQNFCVKLFGSLFYFGENCFLDFCLLEAALSNQHILVFVLVYFFLQVSGKPICLTRVN